jgi:carbamoyl-phosphate synthase/aspartate carbamoyltransferase/dihydroorotase
VHSLSRLLAQFRINLHCVSPDILRMPPELVAELKIGGMSIQEHTTLDEILPETDVLYVTRVQKERFEDQGVYESVKGAFVVTPEILKLAKDQMIVMHPLPRVGEIAMDVDADPRAAYFRQMEYGLYIRMALLAMVLGKA